MHVDAKLPRVIEHQKSLRLWDAQEICRMIGLEWAVAVKLAAERYLSFNPQEAARLDDVQAAELLFVGALAAHGCDNRLLDTFLATLKKPYCYEHQRIAYDWRHRRWFEIPQPETHPDQSSGEQSAIDWTVKSPPRPNSDELLMFSLRDG